MDRYVVIGHPVEHSVSPFIHGLFAQQTGQALDYGRCLSPLDGFGATALDLAAQGVKGCNVTVPFKFEAFELVRARRPQGVSARAVLAGAANTLGFDATGWWADNTDGIGLRRDIEINAGVSLRGRRVLLVGAGGAAAGVLGPLLEAGPAELVVVNRTLDKARSLVDTHAAWAATCGAGLAVRPLSDPGVGYDVVINGTASSLSGAGVPVPAEVLTDGGWAWDMMYGAGAEGFLQWARAHGAQGHDGLGMLVEQAAEAFRLWRGATPDTAPVLRAMRERLAAKAP